MRCVGSGFERNYEQGNHDETVDSFAAHDHDMLKGKTDVTNGYMTPHSYRLASDIVDQYAAAGSFKTAMRGNLETAPKNAAVYWYIRVN